MSAEQVPERRVNDRVLDDAMRTRKIQVKELAECAGVSERQIRRWLNNEDCGEPQQRKLRNVADCLGVTPDDLLRGQGSQHQWLSANLPVCAARFKQLCKDKGETPESISIKADVPISIIRKMLNEEEVEIDFLNRIAIALKLQEGIADLMSTGLGMAAMAAMGVPMHINDPVITILKVRDGSNINDINDSVARYLTLMKLMNPQRPQQFIRAEGNSIHIIIKMERADAVRLKAAVDRGDFAKFGVISMEIIQPPRSRSTTIGFALGLLGLTSGIAGIASFLLSGNMWLGVSCSAAGLVLSTIGGVTWWRSRSGTQEPSSERRSRSI